jgi:hypothetical protein
MYHTGKKEDVNKIKIYFNNWHFFCLISPFAWTLIAKQLTALCLRLNFTNRAELTAEEKPSHGKFFRRTIK